MRIDAAMHRSTMNYLHPEKRFLRHLLPRKRQLSPEEEKGANICLPERRTSPAGCPLIEPNDPNIADSARISSTRKWTITTETVNLADNIVTMKPPGPVLGGYLDGVHLPSSGKQVGNAPKMWDTQATGRRAGLRVLCRREEAMEAEKTFTTLLLVGSILLAAPGISGCSAPGDRITVGTGEEVVVLVHGLWRSHRALWPLRAPLLDAGYRVVDHRYPSTRGEIVENAAALRSEMVRLASDPHVRKVHIVGHSLGAILARVATADPVPPKAGRVVQISPPNQGSPWASSRCSNSSGSSRA